jgi:hypothetical protein
MMLPIAPHIDKVAKSPRGGSYTVVTMPRHHNVRNNEELLEDLKEEIGPNTWLCSFPEFTQQLLPKSLPPETVPRIRKNLERNGLLTARGFRSYPKEPDGPESAYYRPICVVANAIQHDPLLQKLKSKRQPALQSVWVTKSDQTSDSIDPKACKARPDINCVLSPGLSEGYTTEERVEV